MMTRRRPSRLTGQIGRCASPPPIEKKSLRVSPEPTDRLTYQGSSSPSRNRLQFSSPSAEVVEPCEGNRIVNMRMLHEGLREHLRCPKCRKHGTLTLSRQHEVSKGIAGTLKWPCSICEEQTISMETSTTAKRRVEKGPAPTDMNFRAALAAVHAGVGQQHISRILGILDLPACANTTYADAEKRVHEALLVVGARR